MSTNEPAMGSKSKVAAALLAFFLGGLGVHQFYLGNTASGIIRIVLTLTIVGAVVSGLIALIEFIIYLTKSDEDFHQIYVVGNKAWF